MTYIKGLNDAELEDFIKDTQAALYQTSEIGSLHIASGNRRQANRASAGVFRLSRELDIAVAIKRQRIRADAQAGAEAQNVRLERYIQDREEQDYDEADSYA